jgi:hypothetical protein
VAALAASAAAVVVSVVGHVLALVSCLPVVVAVAAGSFRCWCPTDAMQNLHSPHSRHPIYNANQDPIR